MTTRRQARRLYTRELIRLGWTREMVRQFLRRPCGYRWGRRSGYPVYGLRRLLAAEQKPELAAVLAKRLRRKNVRRRRDRWLAILVEEQSLRVVLPVECRTEEVRLLVRGIHASRDYGAVPFLADALQEAGFGDEVVLKMMRAVGWGESASRELAERILGISLAQP